MMLFFVENLDVTASRLLQRDFSHGSCKCGLFGTRQYIIPGNNWSIRGTYCYTGNNIRGPEPGNSTDMKCMGPISPCTGVSK